MALITIDDVKDEAGWETDALDGRIETRIADVMARAQRYCERIFESATHTEYHDAGRRFILIHNPPWVTISTLQDGYPLSTRTITVSGNVRSEQQYKDEGKVELYNAEGVFGGVERGVAITYIGGWDAATFPNDLKMKLIEQVIFELNHPERLGMAAQSVDGASVTFNLSKDGFTQETQAVLDAYRLWSRAVT